MLARSGMHVTLVARASHADAMQRDGLAVLQGEGEWRTAVTATTDAAGIAGADLVLVCVKSPDTANAARELAAHLNSEARVLSLQNGVDNAATLASLLAQPVYASVVYVGTEMAGPGRVRHLGRGDLVVGRPRAVAARADAPSDLKAIAAMFEAAGVPCVVAPDIDVALWTKLTVNCGLNAVSAVGQVRYGRIAANLLARAVVNDAVRETIAVAQADGVALDLDATLALVWKIAGSMPQQASSTAQDLERGKATEIDALNGFVAQRGAALGVATPVNGTLHALVKLREPVA